MTYHIYIKSHTEAPDLELEIEAKDFADLKKKFDAKYDYDLQKSDVMIASRKMLSDAVREANLLQWVEKRIMEYALAIREGPVNVIDVAEGIIKKVRQYEVDKS